MVASGAQSGGRKLKTLLRRASERSIEALWNRIGELRDLLLELLGEVACDSDRGHTISDYRDY